MTRIAPQTHEPVEPEVRKRLSRKDVGFVLRRQDDCCAQCGVPFGVVVTKPYYGRLVGPFELDHVVPIALGGPDVLANLEALCVPCHKLKTKSDHASIAKAKRLANPRKAKRKIASRPFQTKLTRHFDNTVTER